MVELLNLLLRIPLILWFLAAAGLAYMEYDSWNNDIYLPLLDSISAKKLEIVGLQQEVDKIRDFERRKDERFEEYNRLLAEFDTTKAQFPSDFQVPELLRSLADISKNLGIEVSNFTPGEITPLDFLAVASLNVRIQGTYIQVMSFLNAVSNLPRIINTKSLELSQPQRRGSNYFVSANVQLQTYFLRAGM